MNNDRNFDMSKFNEEDLKILNSIFFRNYSGIHSQYWRYNWSLIPTLPTSFDNAESIYQLIAWLQRGFKQLLDDFLNLEMEFEDFKSKLIEMLKILIPLLIREYTHSEEFKELIREILKEILKEDWFKEILREILKEILKEQWFKDILREIIKELMKEQWFIDTITNIIKGSDLFPKDFSTTFSKNLWKGELQAGQSVTLPDKISDYDYIRISYNVGGSQYSSDIEPRYFMPDVQNVSTLSGIDYSGDVEFRGSGGIKAIDSGLKTLQMQTSKAILVQQNLANNTIEGFFKGSATVGKTGECKIGAIDGVKKIQY